MSGGAIPASTGILLVFIGFKHPVIILQVSFSVAVERSHTGQDKIHTLQLSNIVLELTN